MTVSTTRLRFVEETDASAAAVFGARDREDRAEDAEEAIAERLADGARASKDVKTSVIAELGVSERTVKRAAERMKGRGELIISEGGFPRRTTWALASGDTPVGTPPDTPRGPTERNG